MSVVLALITVLSASVLIFRAVCVINRLHWTTHAGSYRHFLGIGLSYVVLAVGALLAAIEALNGAISLAGFVVTSACAGLVLFDKRRPR